MGVVNRGKQGDWGRRTRVLVRHLVDHRMQLLDRNAFFIRENMIVCRPSGALKRLVGTEVEIVLEGCGHVTLDQCAGDRVCIVIRRKCSLIGKETDMVTLLTHDDGKFDLKLVSS